VNIRKGRQKEVIGKGDLGNKTALIEDFQSKKGKKIKVSEKKEKKRPQLERGQPLRNSEKHPKEAGGGRHSRENNSKTRKKESLQKAGGKPKGRGKILPKKEKQHRECQRQTRGGKNGKN